MGIRVHKLLGYGLNDLKHSKKQSWKFVDPRINPTGILGDSDDSERRYEKYTTKKYLAWLEATYPHDYSKAFDRCIARDAAESKRKVPDIHDCFVHDSEFGSPKVLVIVPHSQRHEWFRYDDMIDYLEEGRGSKPCRYKTYGDGFYPWTGEYWDIRDGRKLNGRYAVGFRQHTNYANTKQKRADMALNRSRLAINMGFESLEECERFMAPVVPEPVQALCEYTEVFSSPDVVRQLRPMLYVYWS